MSLRRWWISIVSLIILNSVTCDISHAGNNLETIDNLTSIVDFGALIGPRSLNQWFEDARLGQQRLLSMEEHLRRAGSMIEPGSAEYLDWLSQRSSYTSRDLSRFALMLEAVSYQTAKRSRMARDGLTSLLGMVNLEKSDISAHCPVKVADPCRASRFRSFNGECNNIENAHWGKALTGFQRALPAAYADGIFIPRVASRGLPLPSPRKISLMIHRDVDKRHKFVNQMVAVWAQLVDEDVSKPAVYSAGEEGYATPCCRATEFHPECFPIVTPGNNTIDSLTGNVSCMNYIRSMTSPEADCHLGVREQMNTASHWLDGSTIYGSQEGFHSFFDDKGMLWLQKSQTATDGRGLPPEIFDMTGCHKPKVNMHNCLASHAGRVRGSGFTPVTAIKTMLMREHNRIAKELQHLNAHWDSAKVFQHARQIIVAQIQHITFKEFLPLLLGDRSLDTFGLKLTEQQFYKDYSLVTNPNTEAGVAVAALKFWHTLLDNKVMLRFPHNSTKTSRMLSGEMFNISEIGSVGGLDGYLSGLLHQASQQKGHGVASQLTEHWLASNDPSRSELDLAALTIQRGRDHGISGYNAWREYCGLTRAERFEQFEDNIPIKVVQQLKKLYSSVEDVDLYTAGLAEVPLQGALIGPVFACMLGRQFSKLRRADRFWYEMDMPPSSFTLDQLNEVRKTTLSKLICDNADNVTTIQPHAMLQPDLMMNAVGPCQALSSLDLSKWQEKNSALDIGTRMEHLAPLPIDPNVTDPTLERFKRQGFQFRGGNNRPQRQLQPVNQFQNNGPDNSCGEKSRSCNPSDKFRTLSGHCNNLNTPNWGSSDHLFTRFLEPAYADGSDEARGNSVVGGALPPVRAVRTSVLTDVDRPHPKYTTLLMQFGQFIDHDFTNTPMATDSNGGFLSCRSCDSQQTVSRECRPIRVPQGDPVMASFDQNGRPLCLSFTRSMSRRGGDGQREQVNQLTSFFDGSMIYGASLCTTRKLRSFNGGSLAMTRSGRGLKDLLPQSTDRNDVESTECRSTNPNNRCFRAGDARSNEQPGLAVMHTIWARQHNRVAAQLQSLNPQWEDQQLFDETRRIMVALLQHVVYSEWIPRVVGKPVANLFGLTLLNSGYYKEYDDTCDVSLSNEFSTAAFRFGHSLVPASFGRYDNTFQSNRFKPVNLFEHFSRADLLYEDNGVDKILIGLTIEPTQNADFSFTTALANNLFKDPNRPLGTDLIAINIMRGRDHGLPGYNSYRERCNMTRASTFDDLLGDIPKFLVDRLSQVYRHVDDIDLYAGGNSELPVVGGLVGPTFACIIAEQFLRVRKCDRFWYETRDDILKFSPAQLASIRRMSMAKIVCQNSDTMDKIQKQVFDLPDTFMNSHVSCDEIDGLDLSPWQEVSACSVSGQLINVGETKRVSPCISCTCSINGPDCRSVSVKNCADLAQDFTEAQILADDVCKVQCTKDFFDSARDNTVAA